MAPGFRNDSRLAILPTEKTSPPHNSLMGLSGFYRKSEHRFALQIELPKEGQQKCFLSAHRVFGRVW